MKVLFSAARVSILFLATAALFPFVFLWTVLTHYNPNLLRYWNPCPIKVIEMTRNDSVRMHNHHACVTAYECYPNGKTHDEHALVAGPKQYELICYYLILVNYPQLLVKPKRSTLKRIEREFEKCGLRARDVFINIGEGLEARTVIHSIHF